MKISNKDLRTLCKKAETQGWVVTQGKTHLKWLSPEGKPIFTSYSPSDVRAIKNIVSMLRKNGLKL